MKKKFKTTPTQKKADRYIRSAKAQIRTKAEKELEKVQLALKGEIA